MSDQARPPFPPFNAETAAQKVRMAEDGWNNKNPEKVALAYSTDSKWRNRSGFINGREEIQQFLQNKWAKENQYRLIKELWAYTENRIAVRFAYEWIDEDGQWYRSYGNENWEFNELGLMSQRHASINDLAIKQEDRLFHWDSGPRPADHASLSELGL
ncbi:nuclear transport factor 2 family protein [Akkermansiaceae bacterium]|nr:nuclear transport factor 2 family protein [Akkermansiaceae bacterium]